MESGQPGNGKKVGEMFKTAAAAFNKLGAMAMQFQPRPNSPPRWTGKEIEMLQLPVMTFDKDLNKITESVKGRTGSQTRKTLKKKAEKVVVPISNQQAPVMQQVQHYTVLGENPSLMGRSAEVTLNMLNAPECDIDIEVLPMEYQVDLDFELAMDEAC